jgi:hypothetical protein
MKEKSCKELEEELISLCSEWELNKEKFTPLLETLFYKSHSENYFFGHCSFSVYENTFNERFNEYVKDYVDGNIVDFAKRELQVQHRYYEIKVETYYNRDTGLDEVISEDDIFYFESDSGKTDISDIFWDNLKLYNNIQMAHTKRIEFIEEVISQKSTTLSNDNIGTLTFKGMKIELVELIKALVESEMLEESQAETVRKFEKFFKLDLEKDFSKTYQRIKGRNIGSETLFLDKLKKALLDNMQSN